MWLVFVRVAAPTPPRRALSMASSIASWAMTGPKPPPPSRTQQPDRSLMVVSDPSSLISPASIVSMYCGRRISPWETTPLSSASMRCDVTIRAAVSGTSRARSASCVARSSSEAGNLGMARSFLGLLRRGREQGRCRGRIRWAASRHGAQTSGRVSRCSPRQDGVGRVRHEAHAAPGPFLESDLPRNDTTF